MAGDPEKIWPLGTTVFSGRSAPAATTAKLSTTEPFPTEAPIPTNEKLSNLHWLILELAPTNTLSPIETSAESSYELLATLELSCIIQFFPIYIDEVSPLRVTPCHIEDPSPIFIFPIRTALGATQSDNKLLGYFEFEIGIDLRDGYNLSEWPISP